MTSKLPKRSTRTLFPKKIFWIILGLTFSLTPLGHAEEKNAKELLDSGSKNISEGNYEAAISDFDKAIAMNANDIELSAVRGDAYTMRAQALNLTGTHEGAIQAIEDLTKSLEVFQNNTAKSGEAYLERALALRTKGKYEKNPQDLEKCIQDLQKARSMGCKIDEEQFKNIESDLNQMKLRSEHSQWLMSGSSKLKQNDYDGAMADFNKCIQMDPDSAGGYVGRGAVHWFKGEWDQALKDYDEAIQRDPKNSPAFFGRGEVYRKQRKYDEAVKEYTAAISGANKDTEWMYFGRAASYFALEQYGEAVTDLNKALEARPTFVEAYAARSRVFYFKNDFVKTKEDVTKAQSLGYVFDDKALKDLELKLAEVQFEEMFKRGELSPRQAAIKILEGRQNGPLAAQQDKDKIQKQIEEIRNNKAEKQECISRVLEHNKELKNYAPDIQKLDVKTGCYFCEVDDQWQNAEISSLERANLRQIALKKEQWSVSQNFQPGDEQRAAIDRVNQQVEMQNRAQVSAMASVVSSVLDPSGRSFAPSRSDLNNYFPCRPSSAELTLEG